MIEEAGLNYERGKMLRDDSEVEIDIFEDYIWICDYSPSREGAELIKKVCDTDDIDIDKLTEMCDRNNWSYVL